MSKYRFFPLLLTAATMFAISTIGRAQTQGKILFESFANSKCNSFADFDQMMRQVASDKKSKILHLNHHIVDFNDPLKSDGSSETAGALIAPASGGNHWTDFGTVNRTSFSGAGN